MPRAWPCAMLALLLTCAAAASASAAAPNLFWKIPEDGKAGGEAGRFKSPGGIATDPDSGHLFIADRGNARIVELTAWGEFVKAWGWGVTASGPDNKAPQNERQQLTVSATAGNYRLIYFNVYRPADERKQTTVPIGFDWPASDPGTPGVIDSVEEALEDLTSLKASPGSVDVSGGPGDAGGTSPYQIEFTGEYADRDIPPLAVSESTLSGGTGASVTILQGGGSFEVCVLADGDVCQAGQAGGNAPGEIPEPGGGVGLDESDNLYVFETITESRGEGRSFRVQKFSPEGQFLAMWGGEVNKTKSAEGGSTEAERNLCTKAQVEAGDVCGTGVTGTGKGQFAHTFAFGNRIAVGPEGSVFVGDVGRIQKFTAGGAFAGEAKVPGEMALELAMDGAGNYYVAFEGPDPATPKADVRKLVPAGEGVTEATTFPAFSPRVIALDVAGNVYIVDRKGPLPGDLAKVIAYEPDGTPLITFDDHMAESGTTLGGLATSEACEIPGPDLYVSDVGGFVSAFGPAPLDAETCPPPKVAPSIAKQFAKEVGSDSATVGATINPQFWNDTRYYVEYGTTSCASGGCTKTQPLPPGSLLTSQVTKQLLATQGVLLSGLAPSTTYHYRFVAQSSGGGPVYGVDPDGVGEEEADFESGLEGTFKTRIKPLPEPDLCPNAAFRSGAASRLPDCRAYEMVSPIDKENGDIIVLDKGGVLHAPLSLNQSSPDGERLTYSSYRAFGDTQSAPITSTYLASRSSTGWGSHGISPPRGRNTWDIDTSVDTQFKAFSADLCEGWLVSETDPPLTESAPAGFANLYHRDNCGEGEGSYEALIPVAPESIEPPDFKPEVQGVSEDGGNAIFRVRDKLTEDAVPCEVPGVLSSCKLQLYEALPGGGIRAVCILPGETSAPNGCSAGSGSGFLPDGRSQMVRNAISADGSRIFWSDDPQEVSRIFVRIDGTSTQAVSEAGEALSGLAGKGSQYWTAAADGSRAIFSAGDLGGGKADLYQYRLEGEETTEIAGKVYGLLGASEDASRIYLVSGEALDTGATPDEPNLYLYQAGEGGGFTFIGTLTDDDATASDSVAYSPVNLVPRNHTAQVSADGLNVAFTSTAPLTGFDNSDAGSGEADAEVFLYDAEAGQLRCVSCNPTGALPSGRDVGIWAAALIPVTQTQLYQAPEVLSEDGHRLYFESFDALVGADTNGRKDVYQWEALGEGPPQAPCKESSSSFDEAAEGCVDLISSGASEEDSSLVDISASGDDVFISTAASLVPQDPGLIDIYDARALGGFPAPPQPKPPCEGEACQSPPPPPTDLVPGSSTFRGPGNAKASARTRKRCPAGKRKVRRGAKSRCVAKKQRKAKQRKAKRYTKAGR